MDNYLCVETRTLLAYAATRPEEKAGNGRWQVAGGRWAEGDTDFTGHKD
jgi:hypothetical protein